VSVEPPTVLEYPVGVGSTITRVLEVPGTTTPVVLLHGAGARADRWRTSLGALGALGHRALALDLPGHGLATKGLGPEYTVSAFAEFVEGVLGQLDIEEALLVGTSLGAHVLGTVALNRPSLAKKLVMVGPTGVFPLGVEGCRSVATNLRNTSREGIRHKLGGVVANGAMISEDWVDEEYRINNSPGAIESFEQLASYIETRLDDDAITAQLKQRASTLELMFVWGADDSVVAPRTLDEVIDMVGVASVHYVSNAGHAPYLEQTDDFWRVVEPFLSARLVQQTTSRLTT
jgi:pimeloyl-ACP methyl ester carboxylesterase